MPQTPRMPFVHGNAGCQTFDGQSLDEVIKQNSKRLAPFKNPPHLVKLLSSPQKKTSGNAQIALRHAQQHPHVSTEATQLCGNMLGDVRRQKRAQSLRI